MGLAMMSSGEIAALIAQQNQSFMGTAQYAQQISASMPGAYQGAGTIGAYGAGGPPQAQFGHNVPYAPQQMAGFSYGGGGQGYGPGSMMGGAGVSAMGGFAKAGLGIAGTMGGLGMLGGMGKMLDPMSMGIGGFGAARGMGAGMGTALGVGAMGAALPMAGMAFAQHAVGSAVTGAQQQGGIENVLGQHNFSSSSRTGRGFSREDARGIGDMVRNMAHIPEMMTSVSELTRIMDKVGQMGIMGGVRDAADYQRKFKETFKTLKEISKVMGSSLEEATAFMGEAKRSGIHSTGDIKNNMMARQVAQGLTGMSQQQIGAVQQQGTSMQRQMGGMGSTGAGHGIRTLSQLGAMNQMGVLSNESIMELTGAGNAQEGMQQMAGSLQHAAHRMARGSLGNVMTMALGQTKDGRYTGGMDAELVGKVRRGEVGYDELMGLARSKTSGRGAKLSFMARRQHLTAEMAAQTGVEGMALQLEKITSGRGGVLKDADAQRILMQRFGLGEAESGMVQEYHKNLPQMRAQMQLTGRAEQSRTTQQAKAAEFSVDALKRKISTNLSNKMGTAFFEKIGVAVRHEVSSKVDQIIDDMTGRYTTQVTESAVQALTGGDSRSKGMAASLMGLKGASGAGISGLGRDLSGSPRLDGLTGRTSTQGALGDLVRGSSWTTHGKEGDLKKAGVDKYSSTTGWWGDETAHGLKNKDREALAATLKGYDKELPADVRERLAKGGKGVEFLTHKAGTLDTSDAMQGMKGAEKAQAMIKGLSAGFGKSNLEWGKLSKGLSSEKQLALVSGLLGKAGTSEGGMGGEAAADLLNSGGADGSSESYARDRIKRDRDQSSKFSQAGMGEQYAGIRQAVQGGGAMSQLLVGKGGILRQGNADAAYRFMKGTHTAEDLKTYGIADAKGINRDVLRHAVQARNKGVGMTGKDAEGKETDEGMAGLALAGMRETQALGKDTAREEGKSQSALLIGNEKFEALEKGGGKAGGKAASIRTNLNRLAAALKSGGYEGDAGKTALGDIAASLSGSLGGLKGKDREAALGAMGGQARGLAGMYGAAMGSLKGGKMTVEGAAEKWKLSKEELEKIADKDEKGLKTKFGTKGSQEALSKLVAGTAAQRGVFGKDPGADATKVASSFEKFGSAMERVATVFGNISGIQPPAGSAPGAPGK